jgi:hypothetical protein
MHFELDPTPSARIIADSRPHALNMVRHDEIEKDFADFDLV